MFHKIPFLQKMDEGKMMKAFIEEAHKKLSKSRYNWKKPVEKKIWNIFRTAQLRRI